MSNPQIADHYQKALQIPYHGVLFDYDGTLTPRYTNEIPQDLTNRIVELNEQGVVMGLCTARPFETARPKLDIFTAAAKYPDLVRKNWIVICENGSKGFYYNPSKNDYEEMYKSEWPTEIDRQSLLATLKKAFGSESISNNEISFEIYEPSSDIEREDLGPNVAANDISLILRPQGNEHMSFLQWEESSRRIFEKVILILKDFDPNGLLHVGDSKMGVSILPASGDKDRGIREFARHLSSLSGTQIKDPFREILAIGDQANLGGNDYHFLKGNVGTPFTVGEELADDSLAGRVFCKDRGSLIGPEGTLKLLQDVKFII